MWNIFYKRTLMKMSEETNNENREMDVTLPNSVLKLYNELEDTKDGLKDDMKDIRDMRIKLSDAINKKSQDFRSKFSYDEFLETAQRFMDIELKYKQENTKIISKQIDILQKYKDRETFGTGAAANMRELLDKISSEL